jgi:hypothetical protein
MWILPKQLHTLACALDTEALTWDSEQLCQTYEQSLTVNGKPSRSRSFSAALKKDNWMSALSTRTLKPSLGQSFVTEFLSSAAVIRASHFPQPETDSAKTTPDTSGLGSRKELLSCNPSNASSRTSMDTSRWDSPQSSATWKKLVTKRRGEFSARLKSSIAKAETLHTNASASSSWPTASTRDHKGGYGGGRVRDGKISMDTLDVAVQAYSDGGLLAPESANTLGSRPELWRTPSSSDGEGGIMEMRPGTAGKYKLRDHVHAKWATPSAFDWNQPETKEQWEKRAATQAEKGVNLHLPLKSQAIQVGNTWATPNAGDFKAGMATGRKQKSLGQDVTNSLANWATPNTLDHMALRSPEALLRQATTTRAGRTAPANLREQVDPASVEIYETRTASPKQKITHKLNPRFVETLMGLPIGWVMPSCAKPISTAPTSLGHSGMALSGSRPSLPIGCLQNN